jgi:hypothetical protein
MRGCGGSSGSSFRWRPVLADPARQLWLELPGEGARLITLPAPGPDSERPVCSTHGVEVTAGVRAGDRAPARRADPAQPSRATRLGGLVVRSGRAAHETTLAGHEGEPEVGGRQRRLPPRGRADRRAGCSASCRATRSSRPRRCASAHTRS